MSYVACGSPIEVPKISKEALEIAYKTLDYHPGSARHLTIEEYGAIRKYLYFMTRIHDERLYVIEDNNLSLLLTFDDRDFIKFFTDLKQLRQYGVL